MDTDEHRSSCNMITQKIIGCAYRVSNTLGCGFLEKVYENALAHDLRKSGCDVCQQHPLTVRYDGVIVGEYVADLVVSGRILIELKAVKALDTIHTAQCLNYLKASGMPVCLLINFATPKIQIKRLVN